MLQLDNFMSMYQLNIRIHMSYEVYHLAIKNHCESSNFEFRKKIKNKKMDYLRENNP